MIRFEGSKPEAAASPSMDLGAPPAAGVTPLVDRGIFNFDGDAEGWPEDLDDAPAAGVLLALLTGAAAMAAILAVSTYVLAPLGTRLIVWLAR